MKLRILLPLCATLLPLGACSDPASDLVEGKLYWSFQTGGPVQSTPLVSDEVVYFSSDDGYFYALGARSGKQRWRVATGGGGASAAAYDSAIFVGGAEGWVYRLGKDSGTEMWSVRLGGPVSAGLSVVDGVVYVGAWDRTVYALDADTGERLWSVVTANEIHSTPVVASGVVYAGSWDGRLYALSTADGAERWRFKVGDYVSAPALVSGAQIFIGGEYEVPTQDDGIFYDLSAGGEEQWSFWTRQGLHVGGGAALERGVLYFGTQDWYADGRSDYLHAVSSDSGQERWAFAITSSVVSAPAVSDGEVYFQDEDQYLYALDSDTGEELWRFETGGGRSGPVVDDSAVYVGGADGTLWALRNPR